MNEPLYTKVCTACASGTPVLTSSEVAKLATAVPAWVATGNRQMNRDFVFKDFAEALNFMNRVGAIAESEKHHPDIYLHDYKKVTITLSTHAIGGLSENDFIVAAKIDRILI
jgi:4a-hydroxytetrahydrobiopterin dehydratase